MIEVSHTAMSTRALDAVVERLPERYEMSLNQGDMIKLVRALERAWLTSGESNESDDLDEWIEGFLSGVAGTVGVEFV